MSEENDKLKLMLHQVPIKILNQVLFERRRELFHATQMDPDQVVTWNRCLAVVIQKTGVSEEIILGASRDPAHVDARWQLYAALYERNWHLTAIAGVMGHDHARVANGLRKRGLMGTPRKRKETAAS